MKFTLLASIMILFFGGMYLYCYATTTLKDKKDAKRQVRKEQEKEARFEAIKDSLKSGRKAIKDKYKEAEERSAAIRKEIEAIQSSVNNA